MSFKRKAILLTAALLVVSTLAGFATPEYAEKAGKSCAFCHAGANGGPAYVLYKNKVYDVSDSSNWQGGSHFRTHAADQLSRDYYFVEELEWEFYELWHHEGRRARMAAAMMAPDYAWRHEFYELKHRFVKFMELAREHSGQDRGKWLKDFPGRLSP